MTDPQQPSNLPPGPPYFSPPPGNPGQSGGPTRYFYPPPAPPRSGGTALLGCGLALSVFLNILAVGAVVILCMGVVGAQSINLGETGSVVPLPEVRHSGKALTKDKVAIVSLDGVILEGLLNYVHRQIEQAARDSDVKAVVLRVNSPGGSITASDELHHRLSLLAKGDPEKNTKPKHLVVSMASMAASGGYYVAMPAETVFAERTTMTGSIGVFASFPDVAGLAKKWEFGMNTIKQGEIKDSGSPFKEMTPKERQVWQDMVDHAYNEFLTVVAAGRTNKLTKADLLAPVTVEAVNAGPKWLDKEPVKPYRRYRADGGIWTADKALELKLIDQIGTLDDAIKSAADAANLGEDFKAVKYEKLTSFRELLLGGAATQPSSLLEPGRLSAGLTPRLWYLAPGSEMAGILSAAAAPSR